MKAPEREKPGPTTGTGTSGNATALSIPPGVTDRTTFSCATASKKDSLIWASGGISWGALKTLADSPADYKECGGYILGTVNGVRRNKNTVQSRSALTIDVDDGGANSLVDAIEILGTLGFAFILHTTFSHTPGEPRFRIIVPLSREVDRPEFRKLSQWMMSKFDGVDGSCDQLERYMFKPSTPDPGTYLWAVLDGPVLDVDFSLDVIPEVPAEKVTAGASVYSGPTFSDLPEHHQTMAREEVERQIKNWRDRLAGTLEWDRHQTDDQGRGWEALARDAVWALAHLALAPWSPLAEEDLTERFWGEVVPEDYRVDDVCDVDGKWSDALRKLRISGESADSPWTDPEDDFDSVEDEPTFFDRTPVLKHIQQAAHSRAAKAPAVLGAMLAYALHEVHPRVLLSATVGAEASLNLGIALTGNSGDGKSTSMAIAAELLGVEHLRLYPIGSGEGMIDSFFTDAIVEENGKKVKQKVRLPEEMSARIFTVDEGETMSALGDRKGTTLGPFLRTALTGGNIGTTNSTSNGNNRYVEANSYRLSVIMNIHPEQADILIKGSGVGMPQRFVWIPTEDPFLPRSVDDMPTWPGPLTDVHPDRIAEGTFNYPEHIRREIQQGHLDRSHDEKADPRLGHATLTRLKVSVALALLHGEYEITDQWWGLAGELMEQSLRTQDMCAARQRDEGQAALISRARSAARAEIAVVDDRLAGAVRSVVEKLRKKPGVVHSWSDAKPAFRRTVGLETDDIVDALREQAGVTVEVREARNKQPAYDLRWDPK